MTAKELKSRYREIIKEIAYYKNRIEHEKQKEYDVVSIKVTGSSKEFPYLPTSMTVEAEEPEKSSRSVNKIIQCRKKIDELLEEQKELEARIDRIKDVELSEIECKYCIEGKTHEQIANEMNYRRATITNKIKAAI